MKNFILLSFLAFGISTQISAANEVVLPEVDNAQAVIVAAAAIMAKSDIAAPSEDAACMIMVISACGGSVSTQYCDEGLHGTPMEWVQNIGGQLCQRQLAAQD